MNIIICGGENVNRVVNTMKGVQSGNGIEYIGTKTIDSLIEMNRLGANFDRILIIWERAVQENDKEEAMKLSKMISTECKRGKSYVILCASYDVADIIASEMISINKGEYEILVKEPPYKSNLFKVMSDVDIGSFPENITYDISRANMQEDESIEEVEDEPIETEIGSLDFNTEPEMDFNEGIVGEEIDSLDFDIAVEEASIDFNVPATEGEEASIDFNVETPDEEPDDSDFNIETPDEELDFNMDLLSEFNEQPAEVDSDFNVKDESEDEVEETVVQDEDTSSKEVFNIELDTNTENESFGFEEDNSDKPEMLDFFKDEPVSKRESLLDDIKDDFNTEEEETPPMYMVEDDEPPVVHRGVNVSKRKIITKSIGIIGSQGAGVTTLAYELGRIASSEKLSVLTLDFDTVYRGQTSINKKEACMINDSANNLIYAISGVSDISRYESSLSARRYLIGTGEKAEIVSIEQYNENVSKIRRLLREARNEADLVICDIPISTLHSDVGEIIEELDIIIFVVEASSYGINKFLIDIGNIENSHIALKVFSRSSAIVLNKYCGNKIFDKKVKGDTDIVKIMEDRFTYLDDQCEYCISDLDIIGCIGYSPSIVNSWGSNRVEYDNETKERIYSIYRNTIGG